MVSPSERAASIQRVYTLCIAIGLALICLGGFDILLGHITSAGWDASGFNMDGNGMMMGGIVAIALADHFPTKETETLPSTDS